ncbi:MAG: N-acetyl-gamma-glutamyl-phosphate reductase [Acidimicrobiia bacterium]
MTVSVAILGASGYAGGELVRLVDAHPSLEATYLGAHSAAGGRLAEVHPQLARGERVLGGIDPPSVPDVDLVLMALPHGASTGPGIAFADRGVRVIDLGSDFRLDTPDRYLEAHGAAHPAPAALTRWMYGLPELFDVTNARLVAAPGCYPTAALLGLIPLVRAGLVDAGRIVVDAMSGLSGAGRSLREDLLFGSIAEGVRAYGVASHRHRPEMEMGIELATGVDATVVFTPHLVPMLRGMLVTTTIPLLRSVSREDLFEVLTEAYEGAPFVDVVDRSPQTRWVVGSNRALVAPFVDEPSGNAIVISAIDNLLKGAAGQAIQAANLMLGLPEAMGLPAAGLMP